MNPTNLYFLVLVIGAAISYLGSVVYGQKAIKADGIKTKLNHITAALIMCATTIVFTTALITSILLIIWQQNKTL